MADQASREFNDAKEWALNPEVLKQITQTFFQPEVELFASRLNHNADKHISWRPDTHAFAVDGLTQN